MIYLLKLLFGGQEYDDAENLIRIAFVEGKIKRDDIDLINEEIDGFYISEGDLRLDNSHINRMKMALPTKSYDKFKLIYLLVRKFIKDGKLPQERILILTEVIAVLHHEKSRVEELINSLFSNISSGNTVGEAYPRLRYLLRPRQIAFN